MQFGKPTRRYFALLFSSAMFLPRLSMAQSAPTLTRDGDSWNSANKSERFGYIVGFVDAAAWAYGNVEGALQAPKSLSSKDRELLAGGKQVWDFHNIKYEQLIEGMDTFYADYRNKAIAWDRALSYVRDSIHGGSKEYLDRELEFERRNAVLDSGQK